VNYIPTTPLVQLQVILKDWKNKWPIDTNDINAISMEKIVSKIRENNIKLMILVSPHHSIYLNAIPEEEKQSFFRFLDELSAKYNIKIIDFHNKYSNLEIWLDLIHIGHSSDSVVYYGDVAEAILNNLQNDTQSQMG
jgi:hypothetical protein